MTTTKTAATPTAWDRFHAWHYRRRFHLAPLYVAAAAWLAAAGGHLWWGYGYTVLGAVIVLVAAIVWGWCELTLKSDRLYLAAVVTFGVTWVLAATGAGPWHKGPNLTLAVGGLALSAPWWTHRRVRQRIKADKQLQGWPRIAEAAGIAGAKLRKVEYTKYGRKLYLGLVPGQHTWGSVDAGRLESAMQAPAGSVTVERQRTNSTHVVAHVQDENPWQADKDVPHPAVVVLPALEAAELAAYKAEQAGEIVEDPFARLTTDVRAYRPGARSIRKPIPVGVRPDGSVSTIKLWSPAGSRHTLVSGQTGSGKGVFLNNLFEHLGGAGDTLVFGIDVGKKGADMAPFLPVIDWLVITPADAVEVLRCVLRIIQGSSQRRAVQAAQGKGTAKVVPSRKRPAVVLFVDEAHALLDSSSLDARSPQAQLAVEATGLLSQICQMGRSEAVSVVLATPRPILHSLGNDSNLRAQFTNNACFRMRSSADVRFVIQGSHADQLDTTLFDVPGMFYLQEGPEAVPLPARTYSLHDIEIMRRLAELHESCRPRLDAATVTDAGEAYARRPASPFELGGQEGVVDMVKPVRPAMQALPAPPDGATSDDRQAAEQSLAGMRQRVEQLRVQASVQLSDVPAVPIGALATLHRPEEVVEPGDDEATAKILTALAAAGIEGVRRGELAQATGVSPSTVLRRLSALERAGKARGVGKGAGARWYAAGHAPTSEQP